jgi:hypothetical protein
MVQRTFSAADNDALRIHESSPHGTPGNAIINASDTPDGTIFQFTGGFEDHYITVEDTSANTDFFDDDLANSHVVVDGKGIVADGTPVESESHIFVRALDEAGNETGPTIKLTVFSQNGNTSDIWGFGTDTPLVDGANYVKTGGDIRGTSTYTDFEDVDGAPCFVAGTQIATPSGAKPVETLVPGDLVLTADHGPRPVLWRGVSTLDLRSTPARKPILIKANALGPGLPARDLAVSPQHRVLVRKDGAQVFVPAKALVELPGVQVKHGARRATYVHVYLDPHAVLYSEGLATESFWPGAQGVAALSSLQARALAAVCPTAPPPSDLARPCLRVQDARVWARGMKREAGTLGLGTGAEIRLTASA